MFHLKKLNPRLSYSVNEDGTGQTWKIPVPEFYNLAKTTDAYVSIKTGVIVISVKRNDTFGERDLFLLLGWPESIEDDQHGAQPEHRSG